ncbi:hypothetical protein D0962_15615 [Leptolyngbyaceae cyanobacterium CCMR0082]|uniref:Uncharacterized protein n=2 Tax=Adonisia turfae TaxID=2950184 RepID=A0A6M0S759_9CYAN|nr:hypothetical protein [Adonisia turfae]NEZ57414.1 hypothetical protein [Adonisia turfae CCMR0081]NEZ64200.1 hypothetical protein [Adonisia turfae CCMR0082]
MKNRLNIRDTNTLGDDGPMLVLDFLTEQITVRELIRSRVYQEVKDFNAKQPDVFTGLVQPTETEQTLNGYKLRKPRKINWEAQFEKAITAFQSNGFIILVDDEQVTELEDEITIAPETSVTFMKLVPLVGG